MNPYYRIRRWIEDFYYNFKDRCQRFKRGYAYRDVWDMDKWFLETVKSMLIHLRDEGISYPLEFNDRDEWCAVLDEMINCLDFMDEDKVDHFLGFREIEDYARMTDDDLIKAKEMMLKNKDRFFELFNKYFYDLWD